MAGIDLATATARLTAYLTAEGKVLAGQRVEIDGQSLTRANLAEIREGMEYWDRKVKELTSSASGRSRSVTIRPGW